MRDRQVPIPPADPTGRLTDYRALFAHGQIDACGCIHSGRNYYGNPRPKLIFNDHALRLLCTFLGCGCKFDETPKDEFSGVTTYV